MNKTIYIRDADVPIWERAKELAGEKLSPIIVDALKAYVTEHEVRPKGYERIVLGFEDSLDNDLPKKKAFTGRWIIKPESACYYEEDENSGYYRNFAVAETPKGAVVVYSFKTYEGNEDYRDGYTFRVYSSIDQAAADHKSRFAIKEAITRRGVPIEELDI